MKIHHIGYIVGDIHAALIEMQCLGFIQTSEITHDCLREVYIVFVQNGEYVVELVAPISETSPVYGLRKRYRNSPYHICYETGDIAAEIADLLEKGYSLIKDIEPAPAIEGTPNVAFLMNNKIGIIEVVERKVK